MSNYLLIQSSTNSNADIPEAANIAQGDILGVFDKYRSILKANPDLDSVRSSDVLECHFVDKQGQPLQRDFSDWYYSHASISLTEVKPVFIHNDTGHELFFRVELQKASFQKPVQRFLLQSEIAALAEYALTNYEVSGCWRNANGHIIEECIERFGFKPNANQVKTAKKLALAGWEAIKIATQKEMAGEVVA